MNLDNTKEEILQIKLNLITTFKLKNDAVKANEWEAAAGYRDEEKFNKEKLLQLKNEIINEMKNTNHSSDNIEDYVFLQGLLLEFHSAEFYDVCFGEKNMEVIESYIKKYWDLRNQMHQELMDFLNESYKYLRAQMHQFVKEGDEAKGKMVLKSLTAISDLVSKNNKYLL